MQFTGHSRLGVLLITTLICTQINAQESYRSEVGIAHSLLKFDDINLKTNGILGTFYFSPIDTSGLPLAESSFLTRTSSASVALAQSETSGNYKTTHSESEGSGYGLNFDFRQKGSPNTIEVVFNEFNTDINQPIDANIDQRGIAFAVGRYFSDTFHVELGFADWNINSHALGRNDINRYSVSTKYIKQFNDSTAYNLEANLERISDKDGSSKQNKTKQNNTVLEFEADYYFNNRFSIGGGVNLNQGDDKDLEGKGLSLMTNYFFSPAIGIELQTGKFFAKQADTADDKTLDLLVSFRF